MTVHLGIDLGTTYSTVAAARNGRVELLSLGTRSAAVPSVVFIRDDGPPLVGEAAEARAQGDPSRFAREFKRRLGDPTPLILGGVPMGAERLSGFVLAYLVERATERLGEAPASIVLTHPASYTQYRLDLLGEAVRHAGLSNVTMLAEPRAAALHYAADNRVQDGETVAVYDFGGGTFDTALVRRRGDDFELIGEPQGIDRFGGIDIDLAVFDYVCDEAADLISGIDAEDPVNRSMLARLRTDCRLAKERLSADTETVVQVATPVGARDVVINRRVLESMIRFRLADTVQALDRAVRTAGLNQSDVSRVLLVGGSSRIPLVRTLLTESFGRPVSVDADPESAIALGAAAAGASSQAGVAPSAAVPPASAFAAPTIAAPTIAAPTIAAGAAGAAAAETTVATPAGASPPADAAPGAPAPTCAVGGAPAPPPAAAQPAEAVGVAAAPQRMVLPPSSPQAVDEIPPPPGSDPAPAPKRNRALVIAIAAVVAVLVAGVIVVLANRDSDSGGEGSGDPATTSQTTSGETAVTTEGSTDDTTIATGSIQIGDDVGLDPPDGLQLEPMATDDLEATRTLVADAGPAGLDLVLGMTILDEQGDAKGAVLRFQSGAGELGQAAADAVIGAVLDQESVTASEDLTINGVDGKKFTTDDGGVGWIAPRAGEVFMMLLDADAAQFLQADLESLAANNGNFLGVPSGPITTSTIVAPATTVVFDADNLTIADINTAGPTINPPAGFHFEPLNDVQKGLLRGNGEVVGAAAPSLHTVLGAPFTSDDSSRQIGGMNVMLGDGSAAFRRDAVDALVATGADPRPLAVGGFVGTAYTRADGTPAWAGTHAGDVILIGLDVADPSMADMLALMDAANP